MYCHCACNAYARDINKGKKYALVGTGKEGNLCEIFYYLVDFFHGLMDMGVVDFMNKNKKKSAKA